MSKKLSAKPKPRSEAHAQAKLKVLVLRGAQADLLEQKTYVVQRFGARVWQEALQELRQLFMQLSEFPQMGTALEELQNLGWLHYRQLMWRQVRVIYEITDGAVLVHLLVHSRRDFQTHLQRRLLA